MPSRFTPRRTFRRILTVGVLVGVLGLASSGRAQEEDSSGDSEVGESTEDDGKTEADESADSESELDFAWDQFGSAFRALARGEPRASARLLVDLRDEHPEHAAAALARPVLEALRERSDVPKETIPPKSEWREFSEHPAVQNNDSDVYDPGWGKFHKAFVALAKRDVDGARSRLRELADQQREHPTGELAADVLAKLPAEESGERTEAEPEESKEPESPDSEQDESESDESKRSEATASKSDESESDGGSEPVPTGRLLLRISAEAGGGMAGFLVGSTVGGLAGFGIGAAANADSSGGPPSQIYIGIGTAIGGFGLIPLSTYLTGTITGARGHLLWTYVGGLAGTAVGIIPLFTIPHPNLATFVSGVLAVGGSIAGYELSHDPGSARRETPDGAVVRPFVAPPTDDTPALFGLHGRFSPADSSRLRDGSTRADTADCETCS